MIVTDPPVIAATIAVLLGGALRRCEVAALTDGRASGAFTPEATVAARHANTPEVSQWCHPTECVTLGRNQAEKLIAERRIFVTTPPLLPLQP